MSELKFRGINVKFPYEKPYSIQETYMSKVIDCLEDKKHGILESPTGTGKTLCLFAPVTSWIQHRKRTVQPTEVQPNLEGNSVQKEVEEQLKALYDGVPKKQKVLYTARTHAQIAQTISEVRRCDVAGLSVGVMGARDQLCVNPDVMQEKEYFIKSAKCVEHVKNKTCSFHKKLNIETHYSMVYQPGQVLDIEDLVKAGKTHQICPYYLARSARDRADIVLMPYNYIIDREIRGEMSNFKDDIVIFDEGHNVPNTCEENYEFSLTSVDMANGIRSVQDLMEGIAKMSEFEAGDDNAFDLSEHAANSMKLMEVLKAMEGQLAAIKESPQLYPLTDLVNLFQRSKLTIESSNAYLDIIENFKLDTERLQLSRSFLSTLHLLERAIQTLFGTVTKNFQKDVLEQSFKFSVATDYENATVKNSKKLSLFCFNPSFGIKEILLLQVQSLIITSGTLSPLRSFSHEMGIDDSITLENNHIATKSQIPFLVLGTGVNNAKMDGSFKNRNETSYMYSLGMTLTNLILSVPDGVLLLFSSYSVMLSLRNYWENESGIWQRITSLKRIFVEPRGKDDFISCMENYRRAIDAGNGAVLMGVLRGKISEGMDFKDQYCRGVFVVGVPFPPIKDPRVMGKEKYSDSLMIDNPRTKKPEKLYTTSYMTVEAMKTTNQAIGRVIRHGNDYGAIVLVDYRFAWPRLYHLLSGWMRDPAPNEVNFMTAKKTIREFFKNIHQGKINVPEIRRQPVTSNGEPIATDSKYDVYDHKKMKYTPVPWIDASTDLPSSRKAKIKYESSSDEEVDLLKFYKKDGGGSTTKNDNPESFKKQSFMDALGSAENNKPSTSVQYREINMPEMCEFQKRKSNATSPSFVSSPMKKPRNRRMKLVSLTPQEPGNDNEPEGFDLTAYRSKDAVSDYLTKTVAALSAEYGSKFKEIVRKYMTREATLYVTMESLKPVLKTSYDYAQHIIGFAVCVRSKDKNVWKGLQHKYVFK